MDVKNVVRPLVPPVIWSAISRLKSSSGDAGPKSGLAKVVAGAEFKVPFNKVRQDRGTYFVPRYAEHRPASKAILSGGVFEPATHDLIDKIMQRRGGSMVHAGTFFGDMLPTFARSCPSTVYAFEPVLENYVLAKLCVEANELKNVYLQNAGLSDRTAIAHIDTVSEAGEHRGGSSSLGDQGQLVGLVTIDSLDLQDVVVIQLDVEGHELSALQGARATIERNAPIILVEDNHRTCNAFLEELGYSHFRTIPGLFVWVRPADEELIAEFVPAD
ncbi:MAG: FkbM family methyltransferase [Pseudomonadota bacterium]